MKVFPADAAAALASGQLAAALLIHMDLTESVYLSSAGVHLDYGGHRWLGAGFVGTIDEVVESTADDKPLRFQLSCVPSEFLALALSELVFGKRCTVSLALLRTSDYKVVWVDQLWSGELQRMNIEEGQPYSVITVEAEPLSAVFSRPKPLRYNDGDQQKLHPGDTSMRFIVSQSAHRDVWPSAEAQKR